MTHRVVPNAKIELLDGDETQPGSAVIKFGIEKKMPDKEYLFCYVQNAAVKTEPFQHLNKKFARFKTTAKDFKVLEVPQQTTIHGTRMVHAAFSLLIDRKGQPTLVNYQNWYFNSQGQWLLLACNAANQIPTSATTDFYKIANSLKVTRSANW